ncbi:MAG: MFS transporter [Calditrichaeota bacterium]|nr:MAG: MFS transporter [Calditrichota bacterium]
MKASKVVTAEAFSFESAEGEFPMGKGIRLFFMMFLQYTVWGAWYPVITVYLQNTLGFDGVQAGVVFGLLSLATIISPFIGGQLADRYFSTQKVIAAFHLVGGVLLFFVSKISSYTPMVLLFFVYCLLYAPTIALTNSLAFRHLKDSEKEFGFIRVGGTIGWIAIGLGLTGWRILAESHPALSHPGDMLLLAGFMSILLGLYALTLPDTPPNKEKSNPLAFLAALKMMKNRNFAIFILINFIVSTELMFYYQLTGPFLVSEKIGISPTGLSGVMVIAQIAEILVMALLLPYFLPKFGIRKTLILGILAWPLRYIIFAIGAPVWLVIASLSLHGFCYVFFFTASQIYVDTVAPRDIRASAQSLIILVTIGLGMYLGSIFAGWVQNIFSVKGEAGNILSTNWVGVFIVPFVLTVLCAIAFLLSFKEKLSFSGQDK